jgi:hypothetical protein
MQGPDCSHQLGMEKVAETILEHQELKQIFVDHLNPIQHSSVSQSSNPGLDGKVQGWREEKKRGGNTCALGAHHQEHTKGIAWAVGERVAHYMLQ